ncbi:30S ribosomal protein S13 [Candidatus Woesearchaeota archaeon]|nr:30S ribosomal protein S13 [Candidatus Woesearchaeota archaeon]
MAEQEIKQLIRIVNTDLNGKKGVMCALNKIKGVGFNFAHAVLQVNNIDPKQKLGLLSQDQIKKIEQTILDPSKSKIPTWLYNRRRDPETGADKHLVTIPLQLSREDDIKKMKKIKSYKGIRHTLGQPVRGQRTRSNFRANKGKAKLGVVKSKAGKSGRV